MKNTKLYNVMFPIWFLFLFPAVWTLILPANFLIDTLVLLLVLKYLKCAEPMAVWKTKIWFVWLFGFIADLFGAVVVVGLYEVLAEWFPSLGGELIVFPGTCLVAIPGIAAAGVMIYVLNRLVSFRKTTLTDEQRRKLCLALALFTAPYTMLIPLYW